MQKNEEYALQMMQERDVRFVRLWFPDVLGRLKSVAIAAAELENSFQEGIGFDGSAIEGLSRVTESDMIAKPDASTFQILPWRGEENSVASMFCDILTPEGEPSLADSRYILKRMLEKAKNKGFSFFAHPEIEFYLFRKPEGRPTEENLVPIDEGSYFDHVPRSKSQDFRRTVITTLEDMGISVEFSHHEVGPGQQEIDLRYDEALKMADNIVTFKTVVKELALQYDMVASFMPKPLTNQPSSAMHTHFSLFEGENNAFFDANQVYSLSNVGRQFTAGILENANQISAVTNQYVNSYKRLWGGNEAPSYACWGSQNRSAMVRIPHHKPGKGQSARIELRTIDASANPYLAFAVVLAAGLDGIDRKLELPPEATDEVWNMSRLERKASGIEGLPQSLDHALKYMECSDLVADTLGEHIFQHFLRNKEDECAKYRVNVTQYELDLLFGMV